MPKKDLEDFFFRQLEKGRSVGEAKALAETEGWGDFDMWRDWALEAAITRYHKKYGKSDEMKRAEFFYYALIILFVIMMLAYFSRPRS